MKSLEVREFDIIGCKDNYKDKKYKYMPKKDFDNLVKFIRESTYNRDDQDALDFMRIGYKRDIGDVVTIRNFVGIIQLKNGYQIQVLPKISFLSEEKDEIYSTKEIFLKMLRSMKSFPSKTFNEASLKVDKMNLYELFINMYLQDVRQLLKHGLKSSYVEENNNLRYYKGKLLVGQHVRHNASHKERFFMSYEEFNLNRPENKIIKATLEKLRKLTSSAENSKEARQILSAFEMVESSKNYEKDFSKVVINRTTKEYETLMQWSKVFLMDKSFSVFSGDTISKALLFPMEVVYESYVAQQIKKACSSDWDISTQDKGKYLFVSPKKQFALRPDIVLKNKDKTIIMDTKWKNLYNNERKNYGISQADMYQMYAYSKKYTINEDNKAQVWLLYPINNDMKEHTEDIKFNSDDGVRVNVYFVDVSKIQDSIKNLVEKIKLNEE